MVGFAKAAERRAALEMTTWKKRMLMVVVSRLGDYVVY